MIWFLLGVVVGTCVVAPALLWAWIAGRGR